MFAEFNFKINDFDATAHETPNQFLLKLSAVDVHILR